jgi:hypothetical protein
MKNLASFIFTILISLSAFSQKLEKVYLNPSDSTADYYIAVLPDKAMPKAFMFLLDGFGASPDGVLVDTDLPKYAADKGIATFIPVLKTGSRYFGADSASQQSLKEQITSVIKKYHLEGKNFYIVGLSIGGSCAVKYAELAVKNNYPVKPTAVFGVDPPLDFERFYYGAKRIVRLSANSAVSGEVTYMISRIEKEMNGTPETAGENYYNISPYSFSDTTQRAVKTLLHTPIMLITEPDIQWWLAQRGYDYSYINAEDLAAMINELQRLGNSKAVLVTTEGKGHRQPGNIRHPHSWSIADKEMLVDWLLKQK